MLIDELKGIVGLKGWTQDPAQLRAHLTEWRGVLRGEALIMVSPSNTSDVARVVRACAAAGVSIVPQGGNTGLCGGAIPRDAKSEVLLSLSRLNTIRSIDAKDFSLVAEAGCVLADVQKAATNVNRLFALSLAAEGSCQIGGNLSTDAGGINVIRYGTARQQVLGLEVVLADGQIWSGLRSLRKDTAGYDLKQLFLGSEGTLGIITAAALRLFPLPGNTATAFIALRSADQAVELLAFMRERFGDQIQAFELMSDRALRFIRRHIPDSRVPFDDRFEWYALIDVAAGNDQIQTILTAASAAELMEDIVLAKNIAEAGHFWRLRHSISEAQKFEGANLKHDIGVPIGRIGTFLRDARDLLSRIMPDARLVVFGHIGDGNLHYNIARPAESTDEEFLSVGEELTEALYELITAMDGTISAEHGIGTFKKDALLKSRSDTELQLMMTLKKALDPQNTLNPGKVI